MPDSTSTDTENLPPRFGLPVLFYITAVIAAAVGLFGVWGMIWAGLVLFLWFIWSTYPETQTAVPARKRMAWAQWLLISAAIAFLGSRLVPSIIAPYPVAFGSSQLNNIRHICLACHNYEMAHGHWPPAYIADENGKPMHSWRVLILPFIEEQAVFDRYDFNEPWDGPNNSKLVDQLSNGNIFEMFPWADFDGRTGIKLVTGQGTGFVRSQSPTMGDITVDTSNAILVVEDIKNPVNWMSPQDVAIDEVDNLFKFDAEKPRHVDESKFSTVSYYFWCVGMFDGAAQRAGYLDDPTEMREHFTIKQPPEDWLWDLDLKDNFCQTKTKAEGFILVAANLLLAVLPTFWQRKKKH